MAQDYVGGDGAGAVREEGAERVKIGAPRETFDGEKRVALTPQSAQALKKLGYEVAVEAGAGEAARFADADYAAAGVDVLPDAAALWAAADVVSKVRAPTPEEVGLARPGQIVISFVYPAQNPELLESLKAKGVTAIAMDMVPRISRAQKMDALSSMANIAGYRAVIEAGNNFGRFFTGQVTAAGKVPPAKVLVIGAGVAGLSAIGTATSLGAITYAFDVRPEVAEQIESMGAEFVYLDFADGQQDGAATGGYAAPSSPEFREKQLEKFRALAPDIDIVITTALIPGRPAPKLWTKDMVEAMKPGSVVVDLAAEQGGNCELTKPGKMFETKNGVRIVGYTDMASRMATQASTLYANNVRHMMDDLTPGQGRAAGRQHGGRRDPRRHGQPRRRRHLPAAAAQGRGDRGTGAEAEGGRGDVRAEGGARAGGVPQDLEPDHRRSWWSARCWRSWSARWRRSASCSTSSSSRWPASSAST